MTCTHPESSMTYQEFTVWIGESEIVRCVACGMNVKAANGVTDEPIYSLEREGQEGALKCE